jgi:hypothetical protein
MMELYVTVHKWVTILPITLIYNMTGQKVKGKILCAMAQAFSHWPLMMETCVWSQGDFLQAKWYWQRFFSEYFSFLLSLLIHKCIYSMILAIHTYIYTYAHTYICTYIPTHTHTHTHTSTYAHTYIYPIVVIICHDDSRMWNKSSTYKMYSKHVRHTELIQYKNYKNCIYSIINHP